MYYEWEKKTYDVPLLYLMDDGHENLGFQKGDGHSCLLKEKG